MFKSSSCQRSIKSSECMREEKSILEKAEAEKPEAFRWKLLKEYDFPIS